MNAKKKRHLPRRSKVTGRFIKSRKKKPSTKKKSTRTSRRNRQLRAIKSYVRKGYSANKIARNLKKRNLGMKRKTLLKHVREEKHVAPREHAEKYTRHKYRRPSPKPVPLLKQVSLSGYHKGHKTVKEKSGTGRVLFDWVREEMESDFWDTKPMVRS
jgi:hypothetical protein